MNKLNRTYVMGIVFLLLSAFVVWQTGMVPERLVSNEPGPRFFPYMSAAGMTVFAILSMIFDGPKDKGNQYLDKAGWKRLILILVEGLLFCVMMQYIGFWFAAMIGIVMFVLTLKGDKKVNMVTVIVLAVVLGSVCYFGFTRGFHIPLPSGSLWKALGIKML
ncbi:MAG: tripartite tricarboxylate transporter TctB family protein [Faecalibacterium sp.]|nr:tripartite tricarboxylate transporter TctB family protein [Faecalibacterium sp.]MBQ9109113.1 tripartite tricarboxylate transporter TctB family protein [Oscillospiraceae bacterium]